MVASIPASAIVSIVPNVIDPGGTGLDLVGMLLTDNARVPVGGTVRFATAPDVSAFFGPLSDEAALATIYFGGYTGSATKPAALAFARYVNTVAAAQVRGGRLGLTLSQLQALSGTLSVVASGTTYSGSGISLAGATSFSNAAQILQNGVDPNGAAFTALIQGTVMTVTAVASGVISVGQIVAVGGGFAQARITAVGTGTGGTGTYTVDAPQSVPSRSMTSGNITILYDSVSDGFLVFNRAAGSTSTISYLTGTLATTLKLTEATGAVLSQGAQVSNPVTAMDTIVAETQNFATFATMFRPSDATMLALAEWNNGQNQRYLYAMWDDAIAPTQSGDTTSVGYQIGQAGYSGTAPIYDPTGGARVAAFLMGAIASIDFGRADGRVTAAFRGSPYLTPGVVGATTAANLIANGYNFYGAYATANDQFRFFYPGQVSGEFDWIDSYVNQVWMNAGFQLALMSLLTGIGSVPYNADGYALIETAMRGRIDAALSFGAIRTGVTLDELQQVEVDAAAGRRVSDVLQLRGWYVAVQDASPQVRAARDSPPVSFFYTDGGSVQRINLSSVLVQ